MRDDLLDAYAAIDWAVAQVPVVHETFNTWVRSQPYAFSRERDPNSGDHDLIVAVEKSPMPRMLNVGTGSVVHFLRASLDMLAAALACRNRVKPGRNTHFPIFDTAIGASDPNRGLDSQKCKHWLSDSERAIIKSLRPYKGGDDTLWTLNKLDHLFKHERLVISHANIIGATVLFPHWFMVNGTKSIVHHDEKTILGRVGRRDVFSPSYGNVAPIVDIAFNEPGLDLIDESVIPLLRRFNARVVEIIGMFDVP